MSLGNVNSHHYCTTVLLFLVRLQGLSCSFPGRMTESSLKKIINIWNAFLLNNTTMYVLKRYLSSMNDTPRHAQSRCYMKQTPFKKPARLNVASVSTTWHDREARTPTILSGEMLHPVCLRSVQYLNINRRTSNQRGYHHHQTTDTYPWSTILTLSVVHVVHCVPVNLPCKMNGYKTKNQPAE